MDKEIFGNPYIREGSKGIILDHVSLNSLIKEHPTPFFIVMTRKIQDNINRLRKVANTVFENIHISYSVKANYIDIVLSEIDKLNISFELISLYEYDILKRNSLNTDNLIVGGPYLPNPLIERVMQEKNPTFVLYNQDQIHRVNHLAKIYQIQPDVLLRFIAPKSNGHLGLPYKRSTLDRLQKTIQSCTELNYVGIHSHYGTQINTLETYRKNVRYICEIALKLEEMHLIDAKIFDIGGGLPNAGSLKEDQLITIFKAMKNEFNAYGYPNPRIYMEPGRYIVEDAGLFVMEIIDVSEEGGSFFVNAGNYILPRFARNSLRFYNTNQPLSHYNHRTTIYGIVPSEEDILVKNYNFSSNNKIGDPILVLNCGAYALTFSNRFPYRLPPIITICDSHYEMHQINT
ncbi:MAG: hypothetical protein JW776_02875 [Candidatus Lokiarchaeota archaeon]|nr:hypothetical protein [Candidatus Lokiarchaeota archaeon]